MSSGIAVNMSLTMTAALVSPILCVAGMNSSTA